MASKTRRFIKHEIFTPRVSTIINGFPGGRVGWLDDRRGIKSSVYLDERPVDRTNLSDAQVFLNSCKTRIRGSPWTRGRQARVRR